MQKIKGCLFDLDGVLVDTAKYHYLAWKKLANKLGFDFTQEDNEQLKGVSRMASLGILLGIGKINATEEQKLPWADDKNQIYVEYLKQLDSTALLPGTLSYLQALRKAGIKIALGSASKNSPMILQQLDITKYFDAIIDGNSVTKAKPDPEVFVKGAQALGLTCEECAVFEDSLAGIKAAKAGGMLAVGIGTKENLMYADYYIKDLQEAFEKNMLF